MENIWDRQHVKEERFNKTIEGREPLTGDALRNFLYGHDGQCLDIIPAKGTNARLASSNYYFVNGIMNTFTKAESSAQSIADMLGVKVTLVYSQTEGLIEDVKKAFEIHAQKCLTQATQQIAQFVKNDLLRGKKVVVMAHSRGAAVVRMAIENLKVNPVPDQQLTVVTFGGFAPPAEDWKTRGTVISFINDNGFWKTDPIPSVNGTVIIPSAPNLDVHKFENYLGWIRIYQKLEAKHFSGKITIRTYFLQDFPDL